MVTIPFCAEFFTIVDGFILWGYYSKRRERFQEVLSKYSEHSMHFCANAGSLSISQLGQMGPGGLEHQFFGANLVKGHFHQRIAAHGPDAEHHTVSEGIVANTVAGP